MKFKTTKSAIKANYNNVYSIGYCGAQYLLKGLEPIAYTSGVYGWNADIYEINDNTALVTGYRPFGESLNYNMVEKFETAARKIAHDYNTTYEEQNRRLQEVQRDFFGTILNK